MKSVLLLIVLLSSTAVVNAQSTQKSDSSQTLKTAVYQRGIVPAREALGESLRLKVYAETQKYPTSVTLYATVLDAAGNFVAELAPPYVSESVMNTNWTSLVETAAEDREHAVDKFTVEEIREGAATPLAVSFVLDYSGSMSDALGALENAVRMAMNERGKSDLVAITKFDHGERVEQKLTAEAVPLDKILRGFDGYGGATALYDACLSGIAELSDVKNRRKVLIVFTDGDDNSSLFSSATDVVAAARASGVLVFPISFSSANRYALDYLASETGGRYYDALAEGDFEGILKEILLINKVYYRIQYAPPKFDGEHAVALTVKGPSQQTSGTALYKRQWDMAQVDVGGPKLLALFPFDKHQRYIAADGTVRKLVTYLKAHRDMRVRLSGHTDLAGNAAYNRTLSRLRAQRIARDLVRQGVKPRQVAATGLGELKPIHRPDHPDRRRALENRRVEAEIEPMPVKRRRASR